MSDDLINSVKQLMQLGKGDPGRLEYILDMLITGRVLPFSDQKYLQNIIPLYLGGQDQESTQTKNEHAVDQLQKEIQNLSHRLVKLERRGFERYVGKKAVFFFVTVFVGWHALQTYSATFLNMFLPDNFTQYFFPLTLLENSFNYQIVQFVFTAMMYAWLFIGFIHLARLIKSRKTPN
ncbi:MAG: hypothetical protein HY222_04395 [Thaumarchaeota archaeon]|nr:hypothetical protein [Nitrososphaerota archaeon]MBI3641615.1 hypothetical protein [Nitrososphaerota archaeon]